MAAKRCHPHTVTAVTKPTRRRLISLGTWVLAVAVAMLVPSSQITSTVSLASADRPNVVLIMTDDQDADSVAHMPKLNSLLIEQGTSFSHFFASHPLCCPSRATILRGQYEHNHGVVANTPRKGGGFETFFELGHESSTVATWLQAAGYSTVYVGKYLNGYGRQEDPAITYIPPGWSEWYVLVAGANAPYFDYSLNENGSIISYGSDPEDYSTDVWAARASDFIARHASQKEPFFIFVAPYAPHKPATPAPRHEALFSDSKAPRPPSFNEADVSDKPGFVGDLPLLTEADIEKIDDLYRDRLRSLQAVDDMIETVVEALDSAGELDNTYIMFVSDNGYHQGQHRLERGKDLPYEEDIKVPLIIRGPGVRANRVVSELSGNVDLAPTIADLAGASPAEFVDGRSLVPLLNSYGGSSSADVPWRRIFLLENYGVSRAPFVGLRTRHEAYVEYESGEREFYELWTDPYQLNNSYDGASGRIESLSSRLETLSQCVAAECRSAEE